MSPPRPQHAWTLRRRIGKVFALVTGVAVLLLAAVVVSAVGFVVTGNSVVYRWQPSIAATQRVLTDLVDQETGVRGYALTRDDRFLEPYRQYRSAQVSDLVALHDHVGDDSGLKRRLTALEAAAHRWQGTIAEPSVRGITAGSDAAVQLAESARAKDLFDAVRARAADLTAAVTAKAAAARDARRTFLLILIVALALAVVLMSAAGLTMWRGLHRWVLEPIDRLGARNARGRRGGHLPPDRRRRPGRAHRSRPRRRGHAAADRRPAGPGRGDPRGAADQGRGARALQRRSAAVRLRRLARPVRAVAQGRELLPAARAAVRAAARRPGPPVHRLRRRRRQADAARSSPTCWRCRGSAARPRSSCRSSWMPRSTTPSPRSPT